MMLKRTGSLSIKMAPVLSLREGILPDNNEVKKVSGMDVKVCLVVDTLCPPTLRLMTSERDEDHDVDDGDVVNTGSELGISVDFLLEADDVLRDNDFSGEALLEMDPVPEEIDDAVLHVDVYSFECPRRELLLPSMHWQNGS